MSRDTRGNCDYCDAHPETGGLWRNNHLFRYVDEFAWRLNEGNVARHTTERLDSFVDAVAGRHITWKELTA